MAQSHPINRALLSIVENQAARTEAAFEGIRADVFLVEPGGDCNSVQRIGRHLLQLRRFQMTLLESPRAAIVDVPEAVGSVDALLKRLGAATDELRAAIAEHDPEDWYRVPAKPREGKWGEEATILRFVRPLNDFVNHLGAVRAIRRVMGNGCERTQ